MRPYVPSGFFVLRTPLLPLDEFLALSAGRSFAWTLRAGGDLSAAADADRKLLRARLRELVERPEVREALWLASPDFYESLSTWKGAPESAKGQRLERALYRYVARMTSRPTPFGLFAGCTVGTIAAETCLALDSRDQYWRSSRLDMEYLCNLAEKISLDPSRQQHLRFRPNTSLYLVAGRYHHSQGYLSKDLRYYRLIATEPTSYLAATLERAAVGATALELAGALVNDDAEISLQEAQAYIGQLIQSQLLVPELTPPITGVEPLEHMLTELERAQESSASTTLKSIAGHLSALDQHPLGNAPESYRKIIDEVSGLPCDFKPDHLIQVDMMKKAAQATLGQLMIRDVLRGIECLRSLAAPHPDPFEQFKKDFQERYQDQEIPLVLALDEETGIGFERKDGPAASPEPLLENLDLSGLEEEPPRRMGKAEMILLRRIQELAWERKTILELDEKFLEELRVNDPLPLPDAFAAMVQIVGTAEPQSGECSVYLQGITGPSGVLLLGRFCPADDQLTAHVRSHIWAEEENRIGQRVIFAEVAHLPEGRVGNVICRPVLREYEIPFLANSLLAPDRQIPVTDLLVSIRNDRVVLRSRRLECEVIPRLTSAHSYLHGRNLKLYKFLCLLQAQGLSSNLGWDWGILDEAAFLPRVVVGNIVLAPARWRMDKKTIEEFARLSGVERLRRIDTWRSNLGMPRFALLAEADNQLLIDFENVLSLETLIEYVKNRQSIRLVETLAAPDASCVHGPEGGFTHEIVIPFVSGKAQERAAQPSPGAGTLAVRQNEDKRNLLPGSEWLFAKIYASPTQLDRLLVEHVAPLVQKAITSQAADAWFFIRYGDPHWHLRLRFHGDPARLNAEVLSALWDCLDLQRREGKAWRVQLDTYEREVERYGGPAGMRISERLFQYDSELVLDLLAAIRGQLGGEIRWQLAFAAVDRLLQGLGLSISARRALVNRLGEFQEKNFGVQQAYRKQISEKFRGQRQVLEKLLESPEHGSVFPTAAQTALERFSGQMKTIHLELEQARDTGELTKPIEELAGSYVHMHLNRIFRAAANAQEMVLYDFLARAYDSHMAREKKASVK